MKKNLALMFVMLMAVVSFAKSKIEFEKVSVDFGEAEPGEVKNFSFFFVNKGDSVLSITNVAGSCGCVVSTLDKKDYQPGEKGEIPVRFNSRGYNGRVTKSITVKSNDPDNAELRLELTGNVIMKNFAMPQLSEEKIELKGLKLFKKYIKEVKITNTGNLELNIIEVTHSPDLTIEFENKVVRPNETQKIIVTFKPMEMGAFSKFISIRTNAVSKANLFIMINAETTIK